MADVEIKKPKTKKQKEFIKRVVNGEVPHQAAIKAGYSAPGASASQNMENYRGYIEDQMEKNGITFDLIFQTLKGCLKATWRDKTGKDLPDYSSRIKAVDISLKLRAAYPVEKREISGEGGGPIVTRVLYADD